MKTLATTSHDDSAAASRRPEPFGLEETGETWTGTIVCVLLAYAIPPAVAIIVLVAWLT